MALTNLDDVKNRVAVLLQALESVQLFPFTTRIKLRRIILGELCQLADEIKVLLEKEQEGSKGHERNA